MGWSIESGKMRALLTKNPRKPKRKRGNGEGSVRKLPSGRWRWEIMIDGGRHSGTCDNKTLAQQALAQQIADASRGGVVDPQAITVSEYLEQWLVSKQKTRAVRSTELQSALLRRYIAPAFGHIRLQKLTPTDLRKLFNSLTARDLGSSTQRQVHQFLRHALSDALQLELVVRNVADIVRPTPPKKAQTDELQAYTADETAKFIAACRVDPRGAIFEFALGTGMRRGEFCGLRWQDVDLEGQTAQVRVSVSDASGTLREDEPKTAGSRRTVYLSTSMVQLLEQQQRYQEQQRHTLGKTWQDSGRVFTNSLGGTLLPNNLRRDMRRICEKAGVRLLRIHGLRDTYASLSARAGVPIEVISKQLGHTNVAFTLNAYRTVFTDERQKWALDVDDLTNDS